MIYRDASHASANTNSADAWGASQQKGTILKNEPLNQDASQPENMIFLRERN